MKKSWQDKDVSEVYVKSIDPKSTNEINLTKKLYHDPFFLSLLPDLSNKKVLDIGCGDGYMLKALNKLYAGLELVGTDLPNMLEKNTSEKNIEFVPADCQELPFANNSFDYVISSLMFHWVDNLERIAEEIYRVLKPKGMVITSNINPNTFHVGEWKNMDPAKPEYVLTKDITKEQQFDVYLNKTVGPLTYYMRPVNHYKETFEEVGFTNVKIHEPLLKDKEVLEQYPGLRKYAFYPLYLFITANK